MFLWKNLTVLKDTSGFEIETLDNILETSPNPLRQSIKQSKILTPVY